MWNSSVSCLLHGMSFCGNKYSIWQLTDLFISDENGNVWSLFAGTPHFKDSYLCSNGTRHTDTHHSIIKLKLCWMTLQIFRHDLQEYNALYTGLYQKMGNNHPWGVTYHTWASPANFLHSMPIPFGNCLMYAYQASTCSCRQQFDASFPAVVPAKYPTIRAFYGQK